MALESATHINDLVTTNPPGSDNLSTADDHLRLIKSVLKTDLPLTGAVTATHTQLNYCNFTPTANRAVYHNGTNFATSSTTATELGYVNGVTSAIQTQLNAKAPLASPTFTGTPAAPTPSAGDNDTSIATTAFVQGEIQHTKGIDTWLGSEQDGALSYSTNTTIGGGEYHCTSFTIDAAVTVDLTDAYPTHLIIRCTGAVTINGTLTLNGRGAVGGADYGGSGGNGLRGGPGFGGAPGGGGGSDSGVNGGNGGPCISLGDFLAGGTGSTSGSGGTAGTATTTRYVRSVQTLDSLGLLGSNIGGSFYDDIEDSRTTSISGYPALGGGGGGGGGDNNSVTGHGGNGGGYVLIIADSITIGASGSITANGDNGQTKGGGGGGGCILLFAGTISNSGSLSVTGGSGGGSGAQAGATGVTYEYTIS